jgi:methionyl-tRNA synthetase
MDALALHDGAAAAFQIVDAANEYIAETAPWALARNPADRDRLDSVLFEVAEAIRVSAVLLLPVIPGSAAEVLRRVGDHTAAGEHQLQRDAPWRSSGERRITGGLALWPRSDGAAGVVRRTENIDTSQESGRTGQAAVLGTTRAGGKGEINEIKESVVEEQAVAASPAPEADTRLGIDDFMKVELRVAKVLEAEAVPKSRKLIKLRIDAGTEQRTIVAGIAEAYAPEQLVGRTIVIVANLKPATLMGIESNGMVLAASLEGGKPMLVAVDESIPAGTRVR